MIHSFKPASTLAAQRVVYVSAAETVNYLNTITSFPVGITKNTVSDTTQSIPVACAGEVAELYFNDTVSAGGLVSADSSGRGIPHTSADTTTSLTTTSNFIGVLLGSAVAATGTIARVLVNPGRDR